MQPVGSNVTNWKFIGMLPILPVSVNLTMQPIKRQCYYPTNQSENTFHSVRGNVTIQPIRVRVPFKPVGGNVTIKPVRGDVTKPPETAKASSLFSFLML